MNPFRKRWACVARNGRTGEIVDIPLAVRAFSTRWGAQREHRALATNGRLLDITWPGPPLVTYHVERYPLEQP